MDIQKKDTGKFLQSGDGTKKEIKKSRIRKIAPFVMALGAVGIAGAAYAAGRGCERRQQDPGAGNDTVAACNADPNPYKLEGIGDLSSINLLIINSIMELDCTYLDAFQCIDNAINGAYVSRLIASEPDKAKEIGLAFAELDKIISNDRFDAATMALVEKLVESTGRNAAQALSMFAMLVSCAELDENAINDELIAKIASTVNLISQKAGASRLEIFDKLMGVFSVQQRSFTVHDTSIRNDVVMPPGMVEAAALVASRSAEAYDLAYRIEIAGKMLKRAGNTDPVAAAARVCNFIDAAMRQQMPPRPEGFPAPPIPTETFAQPVFKFLSAMLEEKEYRWTAFDVHTAEMISYSVSLLASKANLSEVVPLLNSILDTASAARRGLLTGITETEAPTAEDIRGIFTVIAYRSESADALLRTANIIKEFMGHDSTRSQVNQDFIERFYEVESALARDGGDAAVQLFENMIQEGYLVSPGLLKLVRMELDAPGAMSVANRLNHFREMVADSFSLSFNDNRVATITYEDYEETDVLVKALFRSVKSHELFMNFAYGVSVLGAEKTREMYNKFGIEHFLRYEKKALQEAGWNADPAQSQGKPILLVLSAKADWNDAFYYMPNLLPLTRHYKLLIVEVESETEFYSKIREVAGWYERIGALVVGGHGNPVGISFGDYGGGFGDLGMNDESKMQILKDSFVENAVVVLQSCSTGRYESAIGSMFSRLLDATVFAPTQDSSLREYVLDYEGRIVGASYNAPTRVYHNGKSEVVENGNPLAMGHK